MGCLNNGVCTGRDSCSCILTPTVLHTVEESAPGFGCADSPRCCNDQRNGMHTLSECEERASQPGLFSPEELEPCCVPKTGWNGTDCSMPICTQGTYDPTCEGVAPGGEGCYRCANGGNCTAPDFCTCHHEWKGYDCRTPVCVKEPNEEEKFHLNTVDQTKLYAFEIDPCGMEALWAKGAYSVGKENIQGTLYGRGNCTGPNQCTCLCKRGRSMLELGKHTTAVLKETDCCDPDEENYEDCMSSPQPCCPNEEECLDEMPFEDPLGRDLSAVTDIGSAYGTLMCADGYEGTRHPVRDQFVSCHLQIYYPTDVFQKYFWAITITSTIVTMTMAVGVYQVRQKMRRQILLAKAEKRRQRRAAARGEGSGSLSKG